VSNHIKFPQVVEPLSTLLADTYLLATKTHGYHWNVTGRHFVELHGLFGEQYEALFAAADELAERIRALGAPAPAGLAAFTARSKVQVLDEGLAGEDVMLANLRAGHQAAADSCYKVIAAASEAGDAASGDLATERAAAHEKAIWMLDALLA
jgi:starvation-inducible DNA-binding protein